MVVEFTFYFWRVLWINNLRFITTWIQRGDKNGKRWIYRRIFVIFLNRGHPLVFPQINPRLHKPSWRPSWVESMNTGSSSAVTHTAIRLIALKQTVTGGSQTLTLFHLLLSGFVLVYNGCSNGNLFFKWFNKHLITDSEYIWWLSKCPPGVWWCLIGTIPSFVLV